MFTTFSQQIIKSRLSLVANCY